MTGAVTDPPLGMPPTPTYYLGICDTCHSVAEFTTARARDLWEKFHPHQEEM